VKVKKIKKIIKAFERSSLDQLEISFGKLKIRMQKPQASTDFLSVINEPKEISLNDESYLIRSPLVGTCYIRLIHESEPLITVGKRIKKNDVVCIIETMKVFNEIKSPVDGVITKINIEDGQMVQYHQPILTVKTGD
jgi:acetyl-CoA carboxylase biotin carboxyl carrier protein